MTFFRIIARSLWYFRKQHLAVFVGTVICTAVLTGALIIGNSVNFSLRKLVETRLGNTKYVLTTGPRFVRAQLANEMANALQINATPLLLLQGIAINSESNTRINTAQIICIDNTFWSFSNNTMPLLEENEAIISENVAQKLKLTKGNEFLVKIDNAAIIPVNTPFAPESKPSISLRLTIKDIVNDSCFGRFSLRSNQAAPLNIFVSRLLIAKKLNLSNVTNCILLSDNKSNNITKFEIEQSLSQHWQTEDAGLAINKTSDNEYYEIVSNRVFIDNPISKAISLIPIPHQNILTYLVNSIQYKNKSTPYSFVSATSLPITSAIIGNREIVVNQWLANDLQITVGDSLTLTYYVIGQLRTLIEKSKSFKVIQVIPIESKYANSSLMPSFPGLSDAGSCRDWNAGIPIDLKKIRDKDEKYWNDFKGTPKAYISSETGAELWSNQFGNLTAIRFNNSDITLQSLKNTIIRNINPSSLGIAITPVFYNGLNAANNAVNFGELFLSLSFFVITAALLLTILLHSLNTEIRSSESGILAGLGYSFRKILQLRFAESAVVIILGGIIGAIIGIAYNYLLIKGLNSVWNNAVRANMLEVNIKFSTLLIGCFSGICIALISIFVVTNRKLKTSVASLIKGLPNNIASSSMWNINLSKIITYVGILGALVLIIISIATKSIENVALYLSAGSLFLIGSSALIINYISSTSKKSNSPLSSIFQLAVKNAGRNKSRSITVILVLAIGVFSIIITGSYRKTFYDTENLSKSGTGGFKFWVETSLPIIYDLNTKEGKENLLASNENDLDSVKFIQIQDLEGDDASCLNLNQVQRPRILGISAYEFDKRNAFSFTSLQKDVDEQHPWLGLDLKLGKNIYPAFADQTVIKYGFKKTIGDTLTYNNETGDTIKFVIIGGLNNSIFQGNLLISNKKFSSNFPSSAGSKIILVDAPKQSQVVVEEIIRNSFIDYGVEIATASNRLAEFNSVENTYLNVFMGLGSLGVIIGTFGMGLILYRNMLERRHEMGLLMAIGFTKKEIVRLIVIENVFLLLAGILCGLLSAIIGIFPSIISPAFNIDGSFLTAIISSIFIIGLIWIIVLVKSSTKVKLNSLLRNE